MAPDWWISCVPHDVTSPSQRAFIRLSVLLTRFPSSNTHTHTHTCAHTHTHPHAHTCTHTNTHTHKHTQTHTGTHRHFHTHFHTDMVCPPQVLGLLVCG